MKPIFPFVCFIALAGIAAGQAPTVGTCTVFPADNIWNTRIDQLAVHPSSSTWVTTIGSTATLRADFGAGRWAGGPIGIPYVTTPGTQAKFPATFLYQDESDTGPYAVALNAPIEGGPAGTGDRHAISVDKDHCILYELYRAFPQASSWKGDSGAIYNLLSNALRPLTWTSADAAGLPIFAGLVRYDEILAGEIRHAIRFTVPHSQRAYVWPARHYASSLTGTQYPPMGARFRLRASFDISSFSPTNQIILTALKRYGMILADNGSAWYLSGAPDERWNNTELRQLLTVAGSNLEAVDATTLMVDPNSGQARQTSVVVNVTPATARLQVNAHKTFTATVVGNSNPAVHWDVNGVVGGNSAVGFIDSISGAYIAPAVVPSPATVTIHATSVGAPAAVGSSRVTVVVAPPPVAVTVTPLTATVKVGTTRNFVASVANTANKGITWKVSGITGGNATVGTITGTGIYRAPAVPPTPPTVSVSAVSTQDPSKSARASVTIAR